MAKQRIVNQYHCFDFDSKNKCKDYKEFGQWCQYNYGFSTECNHPNPSILYGYNLTDKDINEYENRRNKTIKTSTKKSS